MVLHSSCTNSNYKALTLWHFARIGSWKWDFWVTRRVHFECCSVCQACPPTVCRDPPNLWGTQDPIPLLAQHYSSFSFAPMGSCWWLVRLSIYSAIHWPWIFLIFVNYSFFLFVHFFLLSCMYVSNLLAHGNLIIYYDISLLSIVYVMNIFSQISLIFAYCVFWDA